MLLVGKVETIVGVGILGYHLLRIHLTLSSPVYVHSIVSLPAHKKVDGCNYGFRIAFTSSIEMSTNGTTYVGNYGRSCAIGHSYTLDYLMALISTMR